VSAAEPLSNVRRVTAGCSGSTLTPCKDLSDEVFVFNAVPPFDSASPARLPCRVLRQILRDTPFYLERALPRRGEPKLWTPTSYRCRQILECVE
jgi:hypothetical protein